MSINEYFTFHLRLVVHQWEKEKQGIIFMKEITKRLKSYYCRPIYLQMLNKANWPTPVFSHHVWTLSTLPTPHLIGTGSTADYMLDPFNHLFTRNIAVTYNLDHLT